MNRLFIQHTFGKQLSCQWETVKGTNESQRSCGLKNAEVLSQGLWLVINAVRSCTDTRTPQPSSGKAGQKHSTGCLILSKGKRETELTGRSTNEVKSMCSIATAKRKAAGSKSAL